MIVVNLSNNRRPIRADDQIHMGPNDLISGAAFCVRLIFLFGLLAEAMFRCVQLSKAGSIVSRDTFFDLISRMQIPD